MSDGDTSYKIKIEAAADQAKSDIKDVAQNVEDLTNSATEASGAVNATGGAANSLGVGSANAAQDVDRLGKELTETSDSAHKAKASFDGVASSARDMGQAAQGADGDLVRSTKTALQPANELRETIARVTGTLFMLKGAWDVGWAAGSFVRGLFEANTQLKEIKLNAEDVQHVLAYNNKLIEQARAKDVVKTIEQGKIGLASADSLRDISGVQSASMSKLSDYQSLRGRLSEQRDQFYQQFTTSAANGDTEGRKAAEGLLVERDQQIAQVDAQIKSLEELMSQAASQMRQSISTGTSATGSWDRLNVQDFMSGGNGGVPEESSRVPTISGKSGMGLNDFQRLRDQYQSTPATATPGADASADMSGVKTSMDKVGDGSAQTADAAKGTQAAAEKAAASQNEAADNLGNVAGILNNFGGTLLGSISHLGNTCAGLSARASSQQAQISNLSARLNDLAARV